MEVIIYNPNNLKLRHNQTGKIYIFRTDTELLKYDDEKFTVIKENQGRLF